MTLVGRETSGVSVLRRKRVLVEDLDAVDGVQRAAQKLVADGGVFDAHDVELHRLGVDLTAVVKQHPLAQPGVEAVSSLLDSQLSARLGTMLPR